MAVDTLSAASNIGEPDQTGALPTDVIGRPQTDPVSGTPDYVTDLQRYEDEQAQAAAAKAGKTTPQTVTDASTAPATSGVVPYATGYQHAGNTGYNIVQAAMQYLNTPYVWGGTSAKGVDCSGLVYLAYKAAGINMPRVSWDQASRGQAVSLKQARPGDLVAWHFSGEHAGADHIAIYLGGGQYIEAAHPGTVVRISHLYDAPGYTLIRTGW